MASYIQRTYDCQPARGLLIIAGTRVFASVLLLDLVDHQGELAIVVDELVLLALEDLHLVLGPTQPTAGLGVGAGDLELGIPLVALLVLQFTNPVILRLLTKEAVKRYYLYSYIFHTSSWQCLPTGLL